ncbi:MAG: AMP-binding protein [Alphaproteobacteria bacterium]|nr:AMP-binding protein [Alphaproteobacteria bacterium]
MNSAIAKPLPSRDSATVIDRIIQRWRDAPETPAFHMRTPQGDRTITRADVLSRSHQWAEHYRRNGLKRGDLVIVLIDYRPDLIHAFVGAMIAGCIPSYMPYSTAKQDPALYLRSHVELFRRIKAKAVVTVESWLSDFGDVFSDEPFAVLKAEDFAAAPPPAPADPGHWSEPVGVEDIALLQHSSGTTNLKKGVALSHRAILAQADAYGDAIDLSPDDIIVSWLPLYHDMGLMACFILPLVNGIPVVMTDPFIWVREPHLLFDAIEQFGGTLCWLPNFAYHHLARVCGDGKRYDLSRMRAFIDCSEPCKEETFRLFEATFAPMGVRRGQLQTCYAMAETTYAATQSKIGEPTRSVTAETALLVDTGEVRLTSDETKGMTFLSVGRPLDGTEIRIVDDANRPLGEGRTGEISIKSSCLFSGYFELPEQTAEVLQDGWYRSGDLGFLLDGELYITGRKKELIIVRGRNFFAHDIEYVATTCAGVKPGRAVAVGVFNAAVGSEEVVIIAETQVPNPPEARKIAVGVKAALDERMGLQVRSVHLVEPGWLIKTTSGKISRKENLAKYTASTRTGANKS